MSDLLSGVSSYYDTYTKNNVSADKMKDKLSSDYSSATDDEMMEVCKEFEAYFTEQVFKAMEKMVPESDESSSSIRSFRNMRAFQVSLTAVKDSELHSCSMSR